MTATGSSAATAKKRVIIDPAFRTMDEIFDTADLDRLAGVADIVWARDTAMPTDQFLSEIGTASAVVFGRWRHGPDALAGASANLVALLEVAGGHEHHGLDYDAALRKRIRVGSVAPAFGEVVAELGLGLALDVRRGITQADRSMRTRTEAWLHVGNLPNASLFDATVGFVGCGGISRHLQQLLVPFRTRLVGYDPPMGDDALRQRSIEPVTLERLFDIADVIFVLAAPTSSTKKLISRRLLGRLGPHQALVVLSRASVVDFDAMVERSNEAGIRFATDVYPTEPIPEDAPVRDAPHAVLTPHLAGALPNALRRIGRYVVDDLVALLAGDEPSRLQYLTPETREGLLTARSKARPAP